MARVVEREGAAASAAAASVKASVKAPRGGESSGREGRTPRGTTPELRSEREIEARSRGGARGNAVTSRRGLGKSRSFGSEEEDLEGEDLDGEDVERGYGRESGTCSTSDDSRPSSRAGFERESGDAGERRGTTMADLLRALTPAARDAATKRFSSRVVEGNGDVELAREELRSMGQKDLQAMFVEMFDRATTSNNNQWLRRRIASGLGFEELATGGGEAHNAGAGHKTDGKRQSSRRGSAASELNARDAYVSEAVEYTPDGLRKSRRTVKPKTMFDSDAFPSATKLGDDRRRDRKRHDAHHERISAATTTVASAERAAGAGASGRREHHGGKAAVGRRVRVYWPLERKFFAGVVTAFNARTGMHHIDYDDGDQEEIILATPDGASARKDDDFMEHPAESPVTNTGSDLPALDAPVDQSVSLVVPQPGKAADILKTLPASWPTVGSLVWGRVRGHGWWPGSVREKDGDHDLQEIAFFDDSIARLHRHDLLPFQQYYSALRDAKKTQGYAAAISRASAIYESRRQRSLSRRTKKEKQTRETNAESEAPRIWHFEVPKKACQKRNKVSELDASSGKKPKAADAAMFGIAPAPKTLSDLSRDLQDIRKKLLPLAESSWTLFKKQIGTGSKSKAKAADKADKAQTTSEERVVMFDEFASIESLLRWNGNVRTGDQVCPKAVDFDFSVDASASRSVAAVKVEVPEFVAPSANAMVPADSNVLLRASSQELFSGNLDSIQWNMDVIPDPMAIDPLDTNLRAEKNVCTETAPNTPEQHGVEDDDIPFAQKSVHFQTSGENKKSELCDSCTTIHANYNGKTQHLSVDGATAYSA